MINKFFNKENIKDVENTKLLQEAIFYALEYFDRVAGPVGCGIELNTPKHFAFLYRQKIHEILKGENSDDATKD